MMVGGTLLLDEPIKSTERLADGWYVDKSGFFTLRLPLVNPSWSQIKRAKLEAFSSLSEKIKKGYKPTYDYWCFDRRAGQIALRFHHWMGKYAPGFWDVLRYKEVYDHKVYRLIFVGQCEIIFYGFSSFCRSEKDGAMMILIDNQGNRYELISKTLDGKELCYSEHRGVKNSVDRLLPLKNTAKMVVDIFSKVAAIPQGALY